MRSRLSKYTWRLSLFVFFMFASGFAANSSDGGVVYDATADFTLTSNPSGTWSYLYSNDTVRDGSYSLFTEIDPLGTAPSGQGSLLWHADAGVSTASRPFAGINTTTVGTGSWQVGELALHPGRSGLASGDGLAILTWTSPVTGTVNVNYSLAMGLNGNVLWFFEKNDEANTLDSGSLAGSSATDSILLTNVSVTAGDDLNLVIHNNGSVGSDLVRLTNATIEVSSVPEPVTAIAMGLLGVVGFAGNRRRRRASDSLLDTSEHNQVRAV
ncbi:MAG: PEP-CTERM sorting domain-containing protein [Rubripirellula sp.]